MVFLLMGGAYLRSRIKQAGKWDQETIVSFFLCQYCSGEYLRIESPVYHHKSLYYLGGLTEGSETIALFVLMCLWPAAFVPLAYGFALLCAITTLTRIWSGYHTLR